MRIFKFFTSLSITIAICYLLSTKIGPAPPLGKFMDPNQGFWANAEATDLQLPSKIQIDGLKEPVQIAYDSLLIPHIFAQNDDDLYLAQGYVHAFHRLWQMEFQTHAAGGRISELVGSVALDLDRGMRRKGMVFGATRFVEQLSSDPTTQNAVIKYTEGVNNYISSLDYSSMPFEYKLLDYSPEEWTLLKCGLLYKYMSEMLNTREKDIENTNFVNIYGRELFDLIYPDVDNFDAPVVERMNDWDFDPILRQRGNDTLLVKQDIPKQIVSFELLEKPSENVGSNNWAVGPERSATGNPILCNDMHLNLNLPSLWYYNQLHAPGVNVLGHSLPGVPGVITGFTDSIAWGFTNAQRDLVDWFLIEFEDDSKDKYFLDGGYVTSEKVIEEIKIRGEESFYDTVIYTVFGPVVYDDAFRPESDKKGYAMRWIDHDPSPGMKMFYKINRANSYADYMEALNYFTSPAQNIVFASTQGDIAHRVQGKYPLRDYEEGKFLIDGTYSANNWSQYIPNEHNAHWYNPERGFVSSANQHPADSTYPYYYTAASYASYRNRRINMVLEADSSVTIEDMKNLHYDNYSLKAKESLPLMLSYIDSLSGELSDGQKAVITELKGWDYFFTRESVSAAYYDTWFDFLYYTLWDEIRDSDATLEYPTSYSTVNLMRNHPEFKFYDNRVTPETENLAQIILQSFTKAFDYVEKWKSENGELNWGKYKGTYAQHLSRQPALNVKVNADGNSGDIVNATGRNNGPSQRIIVELDPKGVKAIGHYPGGQSGNPGSIYYDNMIEGWANKKYYNLHLLTSPEDKHEVIVHSQSLEPDSE